MVKYISREEKETKFSMFAQEPYLLPHKQFDFEPFTSACGRTSIPIPDERT